MEPTGEPRPTVETARQVGGERINKFLDRIAPLAAPDVLVQIGKNAVGDKATEIRDRVTDTVERTRIKVEDTVDRFLMKGYDAAGKLDAFYEKTSNEVKTRTNEFGRRAAVLGLRPLAWAGEKWQAVCEVPAKVEDFISTKFETKAAVPNEAIRAERRRLREEIAEGKKNLPERQQLEKGLIENEIQDLESQLEALRQRLEFLPQKMEVQRKEEEVGLRRDFFDKNKALFAARNEAQSEAKTHKEKANKIREKIPKFKAIRNLIASLKT